MRIRWPGLAAAVVLGCTLSAGGQTDASPSGVPGAAPYVPTMTFEVASVRESKPDMANGFAVGGWFVPHKSSHLRMENMDIKSLVLLAYGINELRADWPRDVPEDLALARFNIEAEGDAETDDRLAKLSEDQLEQEHQHMLQALLQDRFNLRAHWVMRDAKTYDLVVVKAGRMRSTGAAPSKEELANSGENKIPSLYMRHLPEGVVEHIAHGASMPEIVAMLAQQFRHPVTDKTGLTGKYDFDLKTYQVYAAERKDDETSPYPTLSGAILDQLGLRLVPGHGIIPMLVVEHVERPSAN